MGLVSKTINQGADFAVHLTSGTQIVPAGVTEMLVEIIGGGGGGGGGSKNTSPSHGGGGGGGGGRIKIQFSSFKKFDPRR